MGRIHFRMLCEWHFATIFRGWTHPTDCGQELSHSYVFKMRLFNEGNSISPLTISTLKQGLYHKIVLCEWPFCTILSFGEVFFDKNVV